MSNYMTTGQVGQGGYTDLIAPAGSVENAKTPARMDNAIAARQKVDKSKNSTTQVFGNVDFFEEFVKDLQVDLKYQIDEATNEVIIKVYEKGTDKLIRQMPPEAILHLKQKINDLQENIYDKTF